MFSADRFVLLIPIVLMNQLNRSMTRIVHESDWCDLERFSPVKNSSAEVRINVLLTLLEYLERCDVEESMNWFVQKNQFTEMIRTFHHTRFNKFAIQNSRGRWRSLPLALYVEMNEQYFLSLHLLVGVFCLCSRPVFTSKLYINTVPVRLL